MSLINKILGMFAVTMSIAIILGFIGLKTVEEIEDAMRAMVDYELASEKLFFQLETSLKAQTEPQYTLLLSNIPQDLRQSLHEVIGKYRAENKRLTSEIDKMLAEGLGKVEGWGEVQTQWNLLKAEMKKLEASVEESGKIILSWEATTILNPDALLRDIMRYRGDHFQLATRLGEMVAMGKYQDPEINPADDRCGFGQWRVRFESGQEVFSRNPVLKQAMEAMTAPHREFHRTAAETQQLIKASDHGGVTKTYLAHVEGARKVVSVFDMIAEEAEKARGLYSAAEKFILEDQLQLREKVMKQLEGLVNANIKIVENNISQAIAEGANAAGMMRMLVGLTLLLGFSIMLYLYLTMTRRLAGPLSRVISDLSLDAQTVSTEARDTAALSTSLANGAANQAASLEETSAAIDEITSMVKKNQENSKSANELIQKNAGQIRESNAGMANMHTAMEEIKESSEKIGNILKTIESIAFQTNLLALNAAVEAARAGEAGQGFAVVADEVRNLAQRSAVAVKDTSDLIDNTVECVRKGAGISASLEELQHSIAESTEQIVKMIMEIDAATGEQAQGMTQISQSMSAIDQVNQENSKHAGSNAEASSKLNEGSESLRQLVEELEGVLKNIAGRGSASASRPMAAGGAKSLPSPN